MESHLNHQIWGYAIFWQTQLWLKRIEPHWTQKWTVPCCQVFCQVGPSLGTEYVSSIFKLWILPAFCSRISISPTHFENLTLYIEIQTKDQTNSTQTAQKSMIPCFDPKKKVLLEPFCLGRDDHGSPSRRRWIPRFGTICRCKELRPSKAGTCCHFVGCQRTGIWVTMLKKAYFRLTLSNQYLNRYHPCW